MRTFHSPAELHSATGEHLGYSGWTRVDQHRIDRFAEATGDHQWIHVDPARAADGPFGTTVAHGFLTLSLIPAFVAEIFRVEGIRMAVNYGLNWVRFPGPLRSGTAVRAGGELLEVTDVPGGVQTVVRYTVEAEGSAKPVCVSESVTRFYL